MARTRSDRSRSKTLAIDDLAQSIEQLQAFLPKVEDLGREGFPYLDGARGRAELQLRECIKRAFGEKSPEFQTHRQHKLSVSSPTETKHTVTLIRTLIASLEDKKLELQGLKPSSVQEATAPPEAARPHMTLVPPSATPAPVSLSSVTSAISPPTTVTVHVASAVSESVAAPAPIPSVPPSAPPSVVHSAPAAISVTSPAEPPPPWAAIEPISSLFRTQETKPVTPPSPPSPPAPPVAPQQPAAPPAPPVTPQQPVAPPAPPVTPQQPVAPVRFSATQEVAVPPSSASTMPPHAPVSAPRASAPTEADHLTITKKLCQRFHGVARQLRLRGEYRSTLNVEDELDVQDLLHALLRLQFDDIGTDEWTPDYSNGTPRNTFLLNHDRLAIVVKKTRTGLTLKDLADQVRTDIERYRARGRCTHLLCFVYDPEGRIGNPRGWESELSSTSEHFTVDVLVAPK